MAEAKTTRLNKVLREFNISLDRAVEYLTSKGYEIDARPTTKISGEIRQTMSRYLLSVSYVEQQRFSQTD